MGKRIKVKNYPGIYSRESENKNFKGKPDICYDICYKNKEKLIWEKVGWSSEGYSVKMAVMVRAERVRSIRHGEELPQDKKKLPYFKDAAKKYLEWAQINKTRGGRDEANRYKNHLKTFDNSRIDEITSFHLEKLKKELLTDKKLSPQTTKHVLVVFREIFNKSLDWWSVELPSPLRRVKLPNTRNTYRLRFYTKEEINILLEALMPYKQVHDMSLLSLRTGLRHKEMAGIKGSDIDWNNGLISVIGKNQETDHVYMTPDIRDILRKYNTPPGEYVFKSRSGEKIKEVSDTFAKIVKKLGFNEGITERRQILTFHSLRHTFASWLALQGEQLKTIQEMMRHRDINMTMKYAHLIPSHKKKAAERLLD